MSIELILQNPDAAKKIFNDVDIREGSELHRIKPLIESIDNAKDIGFTLSDPDALAIFKAAYRSNYGT